MLGSLTSAVSGLDAFQEDMNVIGNNIANVNTTGFKAGNVNFGTSFSDTLRTATASTSTTSGTDTMQIGTGVSVSSISNNWGRGAVNSTGAGSDLAILGNGFFTVRDTAANAVYATQDGSFHEDDQGYLVNSNNQRVQGFSDAGLTTQGDIKIDTTGMPATSDPNATVKSFAISSQGIVTVTLSDNTTFTRGQLLLQNFQNPQALVSEQGNVYSNLTAAGPLGTAAAPGSSGTGLLQSGALELSNVDLSNEMAKLITAQRGFEANSKIISASNELLQTVVNMVH